MSWAHAVGNWLYWFFGISGTGSHYGFWSGAGSDLQEAAILGTLLAMYRHHKCATCPRVGRFPVAGTGYKTCHRHTTAEHHDALHKAHKELFPLVHAHLNQERRKEAP